MIFLAMPVILISVVFFLGFGLGNTGMLFLSLGQMTLVPIGVMLSHLVSHLLIPQSYATKIQSDMLQLVPGQPPVNSYSSNVNVTPSYWVSHFTFFCTYLFLNGYGVYKLPAVSDDPAYVKKVDSRKARVQLVMLFTVFTFLALIFIRYFFTGSETFLGLILGVGVFGFLGWGWYAASINAGIRTLDLFGITQQMIVVGDPTKPQMCISQSL